MSQEVEIKLTAHGPLPPEEIRRAAERSAISLGPLRETRIGDTYYDDEALRLARAGVGLRVRAVDGGEVLCFKSRGTRDEGLFRRQEIEVPWSGPEPRRAGKLPNPVRDRTEPIVYTGKLTPLVRLDTRRAKASALAADGSAAEICFDRVDVHIGSGSAVQGTFEEIEIEIQNGPAEPWIAFSRELRNRLALDVSRDNKLERAMSIVEIARAQQPQDVVVAGISSGEAARRVLRRLFSRLQLEEVRVRTTDEPEPVHKLRVACRRMRAGFKAFTEQLPRGASRRFERLLRRTAAEFAEVRDLDVLLPRLEAQTALMPDELRAGGEAALARLAARRRKRFEKARARLRGKEKLHALEQLQSFVENPPPKEARDTTLELAPLLVSVAAEATFVQGRKVAPGSPPRMLHALRKRLKQLRYTSEFFAEMYGPNFARFIERTVHLQEILGAYNDACVAQDMFADLARRRGDDLGHRGVLALGAWSMLQAQHAADLRSRFGGVWSEFDTDDLRTYLSACLRRPVMPGRES